MTNTQFESTCLFFGDPKLDSNDKWKSIKYINAPGQVGPFCDVQLKIQLNAISLVEYQDEKMFVIVDYSSSDTYLTAEPIVSVVPIESIESLSFIKRNEFRSIVDIVDAINGTASTKPVEIKFEYARYVFKLGEEINVPFTIDNTDLVIEDFDVELRDSIGNVLSYTKPTDIGEYYMMFTPKESSGYTGIGGVKIEIQL